MRFGHFTLLSLLALSATLWAGPYDGAYASYAPITVTPTVFSGDLSPQSNFPLLIRFKAKNNSTGKNVLQGSLNNGIDVRFTTSDGSTALSFERERWSDSAADFWVKMPVLNGSTGGAGVPTSLRVYYGNISADEASSPSAVFDTSAGYRAVWHMNGATNTSNESDATQNNFTATAFGAPTVSYGGIGGSRSFTTAAAVGADSAAFIVGLTQTNYGLFMLSPSRALAVGYNGLVLKSLDSGATWTAAKTGTRGNNNHNSLPLVMISVTCPNFSTCYAVGGGAGYITPAGTRAIFKSTDAGDTWQKQDSVNASATLFGVSCNSDTSCVAVGGSTTTTRVLSTLQSGGLTWSTISNNGPSTMYNVHCIPNLTNGDKYCYAVGGPSPDTRVIYRWTNVGGSWSSTRQDSTALSGALYGIHCPSADVCYAVGNFGTIVKTTDASLLGSWSALPSGTTRTLRSIYCTNLLTCVAVGNSMPTVTGSDSSVILKTTDGGVSWVKKNLGAFGDSLYAVKFFGTGTGIIVGANGTVLRTNDGGEIWRLNANSRKLAFRVNGTYDYATGLSGSGTGDNYSMSAWVNPNSTSNGQQMIVGKGDFQWMLQSNATDQFSAAERNFMGGFGGTYTSFPGGIIGLSSADGASVTTGWHHLTGVRVNNTAGGTLAANAESLYVDGGTKCGGSQVAVGNVEGTGSMMGNGGRGGQDAVAIGRGTNLYQRHWKSGPIDEVRVEAKPRSADWVCLSYQTQNPDTAQYYGKMVMASPVSLRPADRNGSNVIRLNGDGGYAFAIPAGEAESAELRVVDVAGRTVWSSAVRLNGKAQTIRWNGVDADGSRVTSGVYFARLKTVKQGKIREFAIRGAIRE